MQWAGGFKIETNGGVPRSILGPALTDNGVVVYMAYVGKGGENLYLASCDSSQGSFVTWEGNQQIKSISGKVPESRDRPALVAFINPYGPYLGGLASPYLVYPDHRTGQLMETFLPQLGKWTDPVEVSGFQGLGVGAWSKPVMLAPSLSLYLVATDPTGSPWYSARTFVASGFCSLGLSEWSTAQPVQRSAEEVREQSNVKYWTLSGAENSEYIWIALLGFAEDAIYVYSQIQVAERAQVSPAGWSYGGKFTLPQGSAINPWAAAVGIGALGSLELIFTRRGETMLNYTSFGFPTISLSPMSPITDGRQRFETATSPGVTFLQPSGQKPTLCVAYKGASTDDLYFAFAQ